MKWTNEETELLKDNYKISTLIELLKLFPLRTEYSIKNKISEIKENIRFSRKWDKTLEEERLQEAIAS